MKWIGALLFISITTWIGIEWSLKLSQRPVQIRQVKNALQMLEAEMLYSQLTLQEAFLVMAKRLPQPTAQFFQSLAERMNKPSADFVELWDKSLDEFIYESKLGVNEKDILRQFGRTLGQHDFYQQQKHIHLTITHLDRELEDARDQQLKYEHMARSLGFLFGLFIVLLLI